MKFKVVKMSKKIVFGLMNKLFKMCLHLTTETFCKLIWATDEKNLLEFLLR